MQKGNLLSALTTQLRIWVISDIGFEVLFRELFPRKVNVRGYYKYDDKFKRYLYTRVYQWPGSHSLLGLYHNARETMAGISIRQVSKVYLNGIGLVYPVKTSCVGIVYVKKVDMSITGTRVVHGELFGEYVVGWNGVINGPNIPLPNGEYEFPELYNAMEWKC
tara:strand:+ start:588 stop:1076 length:489 start_codon:yes stop_codon:yes gene_type:complete